MARQRIPASDKLGFGLDLTVVTAQEIRGVFASIKTAYPILDLSDHVHPIQLYCSGTTSSYSTCTSGASLRAILATNANFTARYSAFSSGVSCAYSVCKSYRDDCQYVLYNMSNVHYAARLQSYAYSLNEHCAARLRELPPSFQARHLQQFEDFFESVGSHIVTHTTYGSRFNLICWISDPGIEASGNLTTTTLESITSGEELMAYIKREKATSSTEDRHACRLNESMFCEGGDPGQLEKVNFNPCVYDDYDAWLQTTSTNPSLISVGVEDIWTIAGSSSDAGVRNRAQALRDAFDYITAHPSVCKTLAQLSINTDWAEFTLTTPGAILVVTQIMGAQAESTKVSSNRIVWGTGRAIFGEINIQFEIYYDGSPVNFHTAHGSCGIDLRDGEIVVTIEGLRIQVEYRNTGVVDNNWNIRHFRQAPTSRTPDNQISANIAQKMVHLGFRE
ncbi:hypothetical protein OBBRIDRAFT_808432 [Obba rivulosa]|uniref:MACPF domain-containing protein n=1 Tax=Obba rivulosa TaxID=1052685 RepID=A0A8E2AP43_9APHY|nr:hypothetical protein OBBRIDRAFT_808432 [Obba rivulosa]